MGSSRRREARFGRLGLLAVILAVLGQHAGALAETETARIDVAGESVELTVRAQGSSFLQKLCVSLVAWNYRDGEAHQISGQRTMT